MSIAVECTNPDCGRRFDAPRDKAGKRVFCPSCGQECVVRAAAGALPDAGDPLVGARLGVLEIREKLGRGGMGAVYLAVNTGLQRLVAVKVLAPGLAHSDLHYEERFLREARLAARLNHPNAVMIYSSGQEDGRQYIEMEFVKGTNLGEIIKNQGRLDLRQASRIIVDAARALAAAHRHGIVHRDIKPDNIMLTEDGQVKVADFGLARIQATDSSLSQPGQILGTPKYMAPEQGMGQSVDGRTDIYSLGATYYHALVGQAPFGGGSPLAALLKHLKEEIAWPSDAGALPPGIRAVIEKMMAKAAEERYQTCDELIQAIDCALREPTAPERPVVAAAPAGPAVAASGGRVAAAQDSPPAAAPVPAAAATPAVKRSGVSVGTVAFLGTVGLLVLLGLALIGVCVPRARQAIRDGVTPMREARQAAANAGAATDAAALWATAEGEVTQARTEFWHARFAAATRRWQAAAATYTQARQLAEGVAQARTAETEYRDRLTDADAARLRKLADTHLAEAEAQAAAAAADLAEGKWQAAQDKWQDAGRALDAACEAAAKRQEEVDFDAAVQARHLDRALQTAGRCQDRYAPARAFLGAHQRALQSRTAAAERQHHGALTGADKLAREVWNRGNRAVAAAETEFQSCRVKKAEELWNEAAVLFAEAQGVAGSAVSGRSARSDYELARARVEPEFLSRYAAADWQAMQRAVEAAQRCENQQDWGGFETQWKQARKCLEDAVRNAGTGARKVYEGLMTQASGKMRARDWTAAAAVFRSALDLPGYEQDEPAQQGVTRARFEELLARGEAALAQKDWQAATAAAKEAAELDPNSARVTALRERAADVGKPRVRVIAVAEGREVPGANVLIDNSPPQTTPALIDLVKGKTYRIRVSMPRFYGSFKTTYTAVPGTHVVQATLARLPSDLEPVGNAAYPPVKDLASGSRQAQERQRKEVEKARLPLEVRTRKAGIVLRLVPAGGFLMGSPMTEKDRAAAEPEPKRSSVPRPIYVGKLEVTIAQWEAVTGRRLTPSPGGGRDAPAVLVSWEECQAFCKQLCKLEGVPAYTYRLPLETEWEYACRAGTQTARFWGTSTDGSIAKPFCWYARNACKRFWTEPRAEYEGPQADPRRPNAFGLHNMLGNVWEWCQYRASDHAGADKMQPFRGGSWKDDLNECRAARCQSNSRTCTWDRLGFRIVRVVR